MQDIHPDDDDEWDEEAQQDLAEEMEQEKLVENNDPPAEPQHAELEQQKDKADLLKDTNEVATPKDDDQILTLALEETSEPFEEPNIAQPSQPTEAKPAEEKKVDKSSIPGSTWV